MRRQYEKVIDYIESNILDGHFEVGDKLPSERELSQMLSVSRIPSGREFVFLRSSV